MKIVIRDKKVRQNIELFKQLINRQGQKGEEVFQAAKKGYKAFINRKTGELRFSELNEKTGLSEDWKAVVIQVHPKEEAGVFEVVAVDEKGTFDISQLGKEAYSLLAETFRVLNQLAYDPQHRKDLFWVLRQIAILDFVISEEEEGERNLIHDAWYSVDRIEAEKLLSGTEVGTYLFRKDEYAKDLEDTLNQTFPYPVTCITLTYCDENEKISEKTLVYAEGTWRFYDDDTTLSGQSYENVKALLATQGKKLKFPLYVEP